MLLIQNKRSSASMNSSQDTVLSQEEYLERLLQGQQHQQKVQQQFAGSRNANENVSNNLDINMNNNESLFAGNSFASVNNGVSQSPAVALSNSIGIGISHQQQQLQQQNLMVNFLHERQQQQQQQQLMAGSIVGGPSDISSNLAIAGLSSNVGLDSRFNGIGSGISANAWMDGLNRGGFGAGATANPGASLYSSEQDFLMSAQRYPLVGNAIGTNRLAMNEGSGSIKENPLKSLLGGLSQFCVPYPHLASTQGSLNTAQNSNQNSFTGLLVAKQAQAALLQAAQARLPRTIRLPCGARGMKADHNSSTAYFDVPENARHGQHLLCSHSVCRAAGVKFRYCFYCKKPVTKQNFRSRHLHANLDPNNKKKDETEADKKRKKNGNKTESKRDIDDETEKQTANKEPSVENIEKLGAGGSLVNGGKKKVQSATADKLERPSKKSKLSILDGGTEYIMRNRWEELLHERPSDDLEDINSWTRKILSVSNPGLDSTVFGSIDVLKLQKQQQQQQEGLPVDDFPIERLSGHWNSLLDQRLNGDINGSNVTNWLVQALELINKYKKKT